MGLISLDLATYDNIFKLNKKSILVVFKRELLCLKRDMLLETYIYENL